MAVLFGVPFCSPSGNPIVQPSGIQSKLFIKQITGDTYTYDYTTKLYVSSGEIDHDTTEGS